MQICSTDGKRNLRRCFTCTMIKILDVPLGCNNYFLSPCGIVEGLASATGFEPCTTIGPRSTFDEVRNDSSVGVSTAGWAPPVKSKRKINLNETGNSRYLLPELCWVSTGNCTGAGSVTDSDTYRMNKRIEIWEEKIENVFLSNWPYSKSKKWH